MSSRHFLFGCFVVFLLGTLLFAHGFGFPLVRDDHVVIESDSRIRSFAGAGEILTTHYWSGSKNAGGLYRPVPLLTFLFNYQIGGLHPFGYRLVNALLHGLVSAVVFWLVLRLRGGTRAAWISGLIFASHPLHVEVLQEIKGREELLAALFSLLALGFSVSPEQGRKPGRVRIGGISFLLILAVFSKESAVGVAFLLALLPWLDRGEKSYSRLFRALLPVAIALSLFVGVRWLVLGSPVGLSSSLIPYLDNPLAHGATSSRVLTGFSVLAHSISLLAFPVQLSPDYSFNAFPEASSLLSPGVFCGLGVLCGLLLLAWFGCRRNSVFVALAALLFLFSYLPASNLIVPSGTIFAERLLYLPSVGFALVFGWVVQSVSGRKLLLPLSGAILLCYGFLTVLRVLDWGSEEQLYRDALNVVPESARVRGSVAWYDLRQGRLKDASYQATEAVRIHPGYGKGHAILAQVLQQQGNFSRAEQEFRAVLDCENPTGADVFNLAFCLFLKGATAHAEAESLLWEALEREPSMSMPHIVLAKIHIEDGGLNEAVRQLVQFEAKATSRLESWEDAAGVWERLGKELQESRNTEGAKTCVRHAKKARKLIENARKGS